MSSVYIRAFAVWLLIIVTETIHGILRNLFLVPYTGDFRARQIGVFIGSALILLISCFFIKWINAKSPLQLLLIGIAWAILTLLFEFTLGRLIGLSWNRILEDYNFTNGGLMMLGIIILIFSPLISAKIRNIAY